MIYSRESLLARPWRSRVIAAFGSVLAAIIVATGLLFCAQLPQHEVINRARADEEVALSALKAKLAVKIAWRRFFFDRELAGSSMLNQFAGAEADGAAAKDRPSRIVVLSRGDSIAW